MKKLHPLQAFAINPRPLLKRAKPSIIHRMMKKLSKQPAKAEEGRGMTEETIEDIYMNITGKSVLQGLAELIADSDWLEKALSKNRLKPSTYHEWVLPGQSPTAEKEVQ